METLHAHTSSRPSHEDVHHNDDAGVTNEAAAPTAPEWVRTLGIWLGWMVVAPVALSILIGVMFPAVLLFLPFTPLLLIPLVSDFSPGPTKPTPRPHRVATESRMSVTSGIGGSAVALARRHGHVGRVP